MSIERNAANIRKAPAQDEKIVLGVA